MNYNNLAQKTNFTAGSDHLELLPFYLTSVNIPGINLSHSGIGGRYGSKLNLQADNVSFNALSFELLIDEDFEVYHEFMSKFKDSINVETGSFASQEFDFWVEVNNNKGNKLFKMEFYNCRLETVGDIQLDTQDDITEYTMSVELRYDYYKIIRNQSVPTLAT